MVAPRILRILVVRCHGGHNPVRGAHPYRGDYSLGAALGPKPCLVVGLRVRFRLYGLRNEPPQQEHDS